MPLETYPLIEVQTVNAVIAASGNITDTITLPQGAYLAGIIMPSSWTAADLTFQAVITVSRNVYDHEGNEFTATAAASRYIALPPDIFHALAQFKIRSGTSGSPVNQASNRTLILFLRPLA